MATQDLTVLGSTENRIVMFLGIVYTAITLVYHICRGELTCVLKIIPIKNRLGGPCETIVLGFLRTAFATNGKIKYRL